MTMRHHRAVARVAAAAVSLVAAGALSALPAYAGDPSPGPSGSPSPDASADPTPTATPPADDDPEPGDSATPSDPSTGTPPRPGEPSQPPSPPPGDDGDAGEEEGRQADLAVSAPGSKVTVGSAGKLVRVDVDNWSIHPAENVRLLIEVGDLSDQVEVELPGEEQDCEVDGDTSRCQYPDLAGNDTDTFVNFKVTPKPGAEEGDAGTVRLAVTSDTPDSDADNNKATVDIELVGSGPDLTAYAAPVGPVKPGRTVKPDMLFINQGDRASAGFSVTITLPSHASFTERLGGCDYSSGGRKLTCLAPDFPLEPGEGVILHPDAFRIKIAKRAQGPLVLGRGAFTALPTGSMSAAKAAGGGSDVSFARRMGSVRANNSGDAVEGDNTVTFPVKTKQNPADMSVKVAKAYGERGDEVDVKFTVANRGPADAGNFHLRLKAPTGTEITGDPSNPDVDCSSESPGEIGDLVLDCWYKGGAYAGLVARFTVPFTITADKAGDDGRAKVDAPTPGGDSHRKNNTAKIMILPPGSDGGGDSGGNGGGLPTTGASLGGLLGGGAAALLLGGALLMAVRWRRTAGSAVTGGGAAA